MADERFDPATVTKAAEDTFTVRRVFGEAYERDGVLVVPVAKLCGLVGTGSGGGEGAVPWTHRLGWGGARAASVQPEATEEAAASDEATAGDEPAPAHGHGTGHGGGGAFAGRVKPLGVYVIDSAGVRFRPSVDANRVVLGAQLAFAAVASVAFLAAAVRRRR